MTEWIKINDRLPDEYDYVLVFVKGKGTDELSLISIARIESNLWQFIASSEVDGIGVYQDLELIIRSEDITHWSLYLNYLRKMNEMD